MGTEHRGAKTLNNRAENSHQPTRHHERGMQRLPPCPGTAQRYLTVYSRIANVFPSRRRERSAADYRVARNQTFREWYKPARASVT